MTSGMSSSSFTERSIEDKLRDAVSAYGDVFTWEELKAIYRVVEAARSVSFDRHDPDALASLDRALWNLALPTTPQKET